MEPETKTPVTPIGRTMYIPRMSYSASKLTAAAFQSIGINAQPSPASDAKTLELGSKYLNGDECLPERITLGNFLKVIETPSFDPENSAFLLPTAGGPCRYGQYQSLFKKILKEKGLNQVLLLSPTSSDGYDGFGDSGSGLMRTTWHGILSADILRKLHLKIRPYELEKGRADEIFHQTLEELFNVISTPNLKSNKRLKYIRDILIAANKRYHHIPTKFKKDKPLIGIVGEIYCRLNEYSNEYLINKIEEFGGEVWISDITEWVWYTNDEQKWRLIRGGKKYSKDMIFALIKFRVQHYDERYLMAPFKEEFKGYEETASIHTILKYSQPYLPQEGALGEMILNVGRSIYLQKKGIDGIIDISPFTCMNGIVCETIYPQVSKEYDNLPIRLFYFDGTQSDLDRDVGIFIELAKNYMRKKKSNRVYPYYFK